MIPIPNQPVNFDNDAFQNPYVDEIKYKQLVQQGDVTQFQFKLNNGLDTQNIVTNSTFSENIDSWIQVVNNTYGAFEWFDGNAIYNPNFGLLATQYTPPKVCNLYQYILGVGTEYQVQIKINQCFNGVVHIYLGGNKIAELGAGVHTVRGVCTGTESASVLKKLLIRFVPTNPEVGFGGIIQTSAVAIDYVIATPVEALNHIFQVVNTEDDTIVKTLRALPNPLSDPYSLNDYCQVADDSLTVNVDWQDQGIANGCYRIKVIDGEENTNLQCGAYNQDLFNVTRFGSLTGGNVQLPAWSVGRTTSTVIMNPIFPNGIQFVATGVATLAQDGLKVGVTYNYEIEIVSITSAVLNIKFGNATVPFVTSGTKTGQVTCTNNTTLSLEYNGNSGGDSCVVRYFRIEAVADDLEPNYTSNPFTLATTHDKTVVLNVSNTENIFGFNFEKAIFSPTLRLRGYLSAPENPYDFERLTTENTIGERQNIYAKRKKRRLLVVENEPEFIHDFLSLCLAFDHVLINNAEFFVWNEDYPPISWGRFRVLGSTEIEIGFKRELIRKTVTGEIKNPFRIADTDGNGIKGGQMTVPEWNNGSDGGINQGGGIYAPNTGGGTVIQAPNSTNTYSE